MFEKPQSELDFDNEKIDYRIVTNYEQAYSYNAPRGYKAPILEGFNDVNEKNYKSESTKRERAEIALRNRQNSITNHKDTSDASKGIFGVILAIIFFLFELIF
ncbi:MAG: hypothetical protein ACRC68_15780 [Clostridium sp.]